MENIIQQVERINNYCYRLNPEKVPLIKPEICRDSKQYFEQFRQEKQSMLFQWITNQYTAGFISSMSVMVGATCIAWVAPMLPRLLDETTSPVKMTTSQSSWMVSLIEVGPLFTPTVSGILADKVGRKPCINFSVLLYLISWLLIIFWHDVQALFVARILQGMGLGITFTIVPMYLGEIAESQVRGALTMWFQTMLNVGLVYEYILGPYFSYETVAYASAVLPILFFIAFLLQPESPYYYLMKNDEYNAFESLRALRQQSTTKLEEELQEMKTYIEADKSRSTSWKDVLKTEANRKALFIVVTCTVMKSCCGFLAILSYATQAFAATEQSFLTPDQYTILIGVLMTLVGISSTTLVDSLGRRPLFLVSSFGCGLCNLFIGTFYYMYSNTNIDLSAYGWFVFLGLALFSFFFSFGLGPIGLTLQSEMFPSNVRSIASSLCALSFTGSSFLCLKFYQVMVDNIGIYVNYWLFSLFCFIGFFITYFTMPETKGKTFTEIQEHLAGKGLFEQKK